MDCLTGGGGGVVGVGVGAGVGSGKVWPNVEGSSVVCSNEKG